GKRRTVSLRGRGLWTRESEQCGQDPEGSDEEQHDVQVRERLMSTHRDKFMTRQATEVRVQRAHVVLEGRVAELCGGLAADLLGERDPIRREAQSIPGQEHRDR